MVAQNKNVLIKGPVMAYHINIPNMPYKTKTDVRSNGHLDPFQISTARSTTHIKNLTSRPW